MEQKLSRVYYNPSHPASFSGARLLESCMRKSIKPSKVKEWLQTQDTYTLHKPARIRFKRNKYIVNNIDQLWQADLNDMRGLAKHNDGVNYILAVIDVFSKYAYLVALKDKKGVSVLNAFDMIFQHTARKPENLQTDKGKEFISKECVSFFKRHGINYYTSRNPDVKCSVVERLNRSIKSRMFRFLTHNNTYRYIDVLKDLVRAYNNSFHRTIKMAPKQVNENNILRVWENTYKTVERYRKPKFKVGDTVRISRERKVFQKGYEVKWSDEIFKIKKVIQHPNPVYELEDLQSEVLDGYFYELELQKVKMEKYKVFKVEKVLDNKTIRGRKMAYVKWKGYPSKFNSWILASELKTL